MSREAMKQPEALRLADALDAEFVQGRISNSTGRESAVELRRLHEALETEQKIAVSPGKGTGFNYFRALGITVLRQALVDADDTLQKRVDEKEKHEHEPVAWRTFDGEGGYDYRSYEMNENYDKEWAERNPNHAHWVEPLYASPQKQWVGLTDEEMEDLIYVFQKIDASSSPWFDRLGFAKAIEEALKEKNA